MSRGYGQFCPIAKASEVLCERWTPLVLRELMQGAEQFNEISRGVPNMSRALLAQRLRELEEAGLLESAKAGRGLASRYRLTRAGDALRPIIEQMGLWAQHWGAGRVSRQDLDDKLLVWTLRRRLAVPLPVPGRFVIQLDFHGLPQGRIARRRWWLVVVDVDVDVCLKDPGYEVDVAIEADLAAFTDVLLGNRALAEAARAGAVVMRGPPALVRRLPDWLPLRGELKQGLGVAPGTPIPGLTEGGFVR